MHIPQRMCVACRQMKPKSELIKIVKTDSGAEVDFLQKKPGRGAYICKDSTCCENARKRRALSRHFKAQIDDGIYDEISEAAENG